MSSTWRAWLTQSAAANRLGTFIAFATGTGALAAAIVQLLLLTRDKPLHGLAILLLPAAPLVAVGQLWMMSLMARRETKIGPNPMRLYFGDLPRRIAVPLLVVALLGLLSAISVWGLLSVQGEGGACPFQYERNGTCVSKAEYGRTTPYGQRFSSGFLLALFSLHFGVALGGRRSTPNGANG